MVLSFECYSFSEFGSSIVLTEFELYYIIRVKSARAKKSTRRVRRARRAELGNGLIL